MFDRIKKRLGAKARSRREQAATYKLTDKPFTKALLFRASHYQDEAEQDLKNIFGRIGPINREQTFNEFVASCAVTIAYHITTDAMKNIGRDAGFHPSEPVPRFAPMVVAYSLFVLSGIEWQLEREGVQLDFKQLAISTAKLFFWGRPDEDGARNAKEGIEAFQYVARADRDNVRDWRDNLMELVPMYVLQWNTQDQEPKEYDFAPRFGQLLFGLLQAVE